MKNYRFALFSLIAFLITACAQSGKAEGGMETPVSKHGHLSVSGTSILNAHGDVVSLAGPSFFWSTTGWGQEKFYNRETVTFFAKQWHAGIIRVAVAGDEEGSYLTDPEGNKARALTVIDAALENGLYVVVDWHSHHAEDNVDVAEAFFREIAQRYGDTPNIIYEIYNEPLNTTPWDSVIKPYAERMIETIRQIDPDNLIVVGSQSWDQDIDKTADNPLTGYENIVYSLHFYAASHKQDLRDKAQYAIDAGLPLMVTEWGSVEYTGDGAVDYDSSRAWMDFIKKNHLSHMVWTISDKDEGSSLFVPGTSPTGDWTEEDLTEAGKFARDIILNWSEE